MANGGARGVMKTQNPMMGGAGQPTQPGPPIQTSIANNGPLFTPGTGVAGPMTSQPLFNSTTEAIYDPQSFPRPGGPSTPGTPRMIDNAVMPQANTVRRAPNINQTAAAGINDSIAGARREMNYRPGMVGAAQYGPSATSGQGYQAAGSSGQGYNAATNFGRGFNAAGVGSQGYESTDTGARGFQSGDAGSSGYGAQDANAQGYSSANATGTGYGAERVGSAPQVGANDVRSGLLADTDLSSYMNQFDDAVVDSTLSDLDRARQIQAQNIGANATTAGAFGGSRHALREAENKRNFYDQAAKTAASLRQSGFNNAQQMGLTDIGNTMQADRANQSANLQADSLTANLSQQAAMANQASANQAAQFGAQAQNQASLANQAAQNRASEFSAGAQNQVGLANAAAANRASEFGSSASNQAALANAAASNRASEFGASADNAAAMASAAAANQASQFGASAANQAARQAAQQQQQANMFGAQASNTARLANQAALNQASQFGAQAGNTASLANQASLNQARQFGSQAANTAALANQNAFNQAGQFNAQQRQAAQMANQNAGLAGSQQRLAAGNQLGNLANLGFGMGQTLTGNLAQDGAMKQGLNQLLIDAARNQYNQYQNQPFKDVGLISAALGQSPVPQTTTTNKQPGLFDYLTLGAGMM